MRPDPYNTCTKKKCICMLNYDAVLILISYIPDTVQQFVEMEIFRVCPDSVCKLRIQARHRVWYLVTWKPYGSTIRSMVSLLTLKFLLEILTNLRGRKKKKKRKNLTIDIELVIISNIQTEQMIRQKYPRKNIYQGYCSESCV